MTLTPAILILAFASHGAAPSTQMTGFPTVAACHEAAAEAADFLGLISARCVEGAIADHLDGSTPKADPSASALISTR